MDVPKEGTQVVETYATRAGIAAIRVVDVEAEGFRRGVFWIWS